MKGREIAHLRQGSGRGGKEGSERTKRQGSCNGKGRTARRTQGLSYRAEVSARVKPHQRKTGLINLDQPKRKKEVLRTGGEVPGMYESRSAQEKPGQT